MSLILWKKTAVVIDYGVDDDTEALSALGYEVTAFDISPEAIALCKNDTLILK